MSDTAAIIETRAFDDATRTATARLMWAAARIPEADVGAVRAAADAGPAPDLLAEVALSQRLGPLLWRALEAADRTDVLGPHAEAVRADHLVRRAQADLLLPRALELAYGALRDAGLEALLFKGPAVAAQYPSRGLRPMDDIDVLVPPAQADRARAALEAGGWRIIGPRPGDHYDEAFLHPAVPHLPLELHRGLSTWRDQGNTLTLERLWPERRPATVLGVPVLVLPPELDLIALAAHAGKPFHYFTRLIWAVDLAVVIHAHPELDWDRLVVLADDVHCRTVVAVGLHMATRLGAVVPAEALALPTGRVRRDALAPVLAESWPTAVPDDKIRHGLRYAMWDHPGRKAVMFAGELSGGRWWEAPARILRGVAGYSRRWRVSRDVARRS
jgi:hypothetical protein